MVTFGFIGCGEMARHHAKVVQALGHEIGAVVSRPNSARLGDFARDFHIPRTYTDWQAMVRDESLDALIVATSWNQTETLAADVIQTGLPVLIEKPLALSTAKATAILAQAKAFTSQVMVGYNRRFYDFVPQLKQRLETRSLLSITLDCPDAFRADLERFGPELQPFGLLYKTSHWVDLLLYLVGSVEVIQVFRRNSQLLAYDALFQTPGGIPVHFQAHFDAPALISVTFHFEDTICQLRPMEIMRVYDGLTCLEESGLVPIRRFEPRVIDEQRTDVTYKPGLVNQLRHFIETCVEQRAISRCGCTLEEAVRVTALCEQIAGVGG